MGWFTRSVSCPAHSEGVQHEGMDWGGCTCSDSFVADVTHSITLQEIAKTAFPQKATPRRREKKAYRNVLDVVAGKVIYLFARGAKLSAR